MQTKILISLEKYLKLKNICKRKYFYLKSKNKIPYKIEVKKGSKKYYLIFYSKDIIVIKSDKNGIITKISYNK